MKLYHFTAKHLSKKIKKEGLTIGGIPLSMTPPNVAWGYIWLTTNSSWEQESLQGSGKLPYSRTESRMTVVIPEQYKHNLLKFDENKDLTPLYDTLTEFGDPENWYVYKGIIPKGWIRKIEEKQKE